VKHQFSARHQALMAVLIEAREAAGLSQRQLSLKLKRSRTFVHRVEIGERVLDFLEAIDVAEALGMDPFDLLDRVLSYGKPKPDLAPVVVTARKRPKRNQRAR
jgi:transcriptional regulator with XRE-family HTH domain